MENNTFEIFYSEGLKSEVNPEEAAQRLAKLLKVPPEKALQMIQATNRVIKSGLTKDQALKYYMALDKVGMQVKIRDSAKQQKELKTKAVEKTETVVEESKPQNKETNYDYAQANKKNIQLQFTGKGFEYFKIWIVNIFLTILTLGIYSAWAKVRNAQYFYGNTLIDGNSFNYTAKPIAILKGRLIAVALFVLYVILNNFFPLVGLVFFLLLLGFLPWIIIRSLAFNARNSMFRNIRFNFDATTGEALRVFLLWPILLIPTLGLILPLLWYKQNNFIVNNSAYGTTPFKFNATIKDYYKIFFILFGSIILLFVAMSIMIAVMGIDPNNPASMMPLMAISTPLSIIVYLFIFAYLFAALGNLFFNSTTLAEHSFSSSLKTKSMAWIYFSNTLAIAFSLGLLIPWAKVRMARYRAQCCQLNVQNSLDDFIAAEEKHVSALGEQVGEVFDMEVSVI